MSETGTLEVDGCEVRWWAWGTGEPTLVLAHGGGAHAGWWAPVLPFLLGRQRIVSFDFSGHGESGHRAAGYPTTTWADEIAAVVGHVAGGRAVLVGHSMGGRIGAIAAGRHPEAVAALVTIDSVLPPHDGEPIPVARTPKRYESREAVLASFRLMPPQPAPADAAMLATLAERSVAPRDGAWGWRFDQRIFDGLREDRTDEYLARVGCPFVAIQGGSSDITGPDLIAQLSARMGRTIPLVVIPGAHHHVTLDTPRALADVLGWLPETRPR
jgi:pimeloyl-ACP methyl ester carboxylesterase